MNIVDLPRNGGAPSSMNMREPVEHRQMIFPNAFGDTLEMHRLVHFKRRVNIITEEGQREGVLVIALHHRPQT